MNSGVSHFKQEAEGLNEYFPELKYSENEDSSPSISGELRLKDEKGMFVDSYFIKIEPTPFYPFQFPHVFETKGRIPINIDWHVFDDGHCCVKSTPEETLLCKQGITLVWFIEQQVKPYFFNQKYREIHGFFLHERSHGLPGIFEFFEDTLKTKNLISIARWLSFIKERNEPNRVNKCFCGSELKYRKCHRNAYRLLSSFSDKEIEFYIKMMIALAA